MSEIQPYPFYNILEEKVIQNRNRSNDIQFICSVINEIDKKLPRSESDKIYEEIAALIYHHELKNKNGISWNSPFYSAVTLHKGNGMVQKITELPIRLQSIIYEFLCLLDENRKD